MTITTLANNLYNRSVNGEFCARHYSKTEFVEYLKQQLKSIEHFVIPNHFIMDITMPDGVWNFYIIKLPNGEYDYWIPDTKEQSDALLDYLVKEYCKAIGRTTN